MRCRITIESLRLTSKQDAGILQRRFTLFNQNDTAVQEGTIGLMVARRPG